MGSHNEAGRRDAFGAVSAPNRDEPFRMIRVRAERRTPLQFHRWRSCWGLLLAALSWATSAQAHKPSDSYLRLVVSNSVVIGQWDIALRDLEFVLGLDADEDGQITWGELKARHPDVSGFALSRLRLSTDTNRLDLRVTDQLVANHTDGTYAVLKFEGQAPQPFERLEVEYRLFFELDPLHRGLLNLEWQGATNAIPSLPKEPMVAFGLTNQAAPHTLTNTAEHSRVAPPTVEPGVITVVFSPAEPIQTFTRASTREDSGFFQYLKEGVHHIWIGTDHILFLLALLLPAVFFHAPAPKRPGGKLEFFPHTRFRPSFANVFKIVTAFTLAHSVTLTLAALEIIQLPSRLVESSIAASIVLAAFNNLRPVFQNRAWMVAFGFGLIHGFGFASVLADLGLPKSTLVTALIAFNLGVELGQLAIVATFLPIAFAFRRTWFYRRLVFRGGSVLVILVAIIWFVERAFDTKIF